MKVVIESNVRIKKEIEVEFPIYRAQRLGDSTILMKVESLEKQINIHCYQGKKIEIEIDKPDLWCDEDYFVGRNQYRSNALEFENAVNKVLSLTTEL